MEWNLDFITEEEQDTIGKITKNTEFGIYGKIEDISNLNIDMTKEMEVAMRDEIQTGKGNMRDVATLNQ